MELEKFSLYQYETLAKGLFDDEINFTDYGQARDYFAEKLQQDTYIVGINGNDTRLDEKRKYRYVDGG